MRRNLIARRGDFVHSHRVISHMEAPSTNREQYDESLLSDPIRLEAVKESAAVAARGKSSSRFDSITKDVASLVKAPLALVTLVDDEAQHFVGACGILPPGVAEVRKTALTSSFCQYCIQSGRPFIVENSLYHPVVYNNGAVTDLNVAAYIGVPLKVGVHTVGALCAIDSKPRDWKPEELLVLMEYAGKVADVLESGD